MKKTILFSLFAIFLMGCGGAGKAPTDYITLGQAFSHVSHSVTYWLFIALSLIPLGFYLYKVASGKSETMSLPILGILLALVLFAVFFRPCEVAANTTVEQAARGGWIGY